jgi:type IV fimbrial biogenesis protein FimT
MTTLRHRGFTLIELMIALAVAGVLMALAAPSFQQSLAGNRLSSGASELAGAVQLARSEAIRANRRVTLCRSEDGSACSGAASTWPGWILFVDTDGNGVRDVGEPVVKAGTFDAPLQVLSSTNLTALGESITFRGDGIARAANGTTLLAATLAVCLPVLQPAENVREINLAFGSRTSLRRRNTLGACAVPANS